MLNKSLLPSLDAAQKGFASKKFEEHGILSHTLIVAAHISISKTLRSSALGKHAQFCLGQHLLASA